MSETKRLARWIDRARATSHNRGVALARIVAGLILASTGVMKYAVPALTEAWAGQLLAAGLPFYRVTFAVVPAVEILAGVALLVGLQARAAALVTASIMLAATYVHLTVADPSLFPLQPHFPVAPLSMLALCALVLWQGAGPFSLDAHACKGHRGSRKQGLGTPPSGSASLPTG